MKVVLCLSLFFCLSLKAEVLSVEYSNFYSHLRKLDSDDTPALQFAFGFKRVASEKLCTIDNVKIVTQKVTVPIDVTAEQRFLLPTEKALKQARAKVEISLQEPANQCDMSVQLETKPEYLKTKYMSEDLAFVLKQYQVFFDDMGSFLSFLMPGVEGLHFHFDQALNDTFPSGVNVEGNHLYINQQWIEQGNNLTFESLPIRITALTNN